MIRSRAILEFRSARARLALPAWALLVATGLCAGRPAQAAPEPDGAAVPTAAPAAAAAAQDDVTYRIVPGDLIEIKSLVDGSLNETVRVGPDGKIAHPLTGYLRADGLTPEELAQALTRELARTVRDPSITVFVREYAGRVVYVGGEVFHPRDVQILGRMSAMSAILAAGGYTPAGDLSKVVLLRKSPDGAATSRVVDLAKLAEGTDGSVDPALAPFDIVIVPPTTITEIDRFVEQYITRVVPGNLSAGFTYVLGQQKIAP
ncbi:MAG: polysaccharide biosynthesis/export family protein [bacterium]